MSRERPTSLEAPSQAAELAKREPNFGPAYVKPELFRVASATELLRGPMLNATYRDCHNSGTSYDPQPC